MRIDWSVCCGLEAVHSLVTSPIYSPVNRVEREHHPPDCACTCLVVCARACVVVDCARVVR
eukprot:m.42255 g.42255  ORF g.42255 m.42255 type:complete len:61 (-) comp46388_c1_seq3:4-186(-)